MKRHYVSPASEELQELLAANILDASGDAGKEDYGEPINFDW